MFIDKQGQTVQVGNILLSDANIVVEVVSIRYVEDYQKDCMFIQGLDNPLSFGIVTPENMSQFTKIADSLEDYRQQQENEE